MSHLPLALKEVRRRPGRFGILVAAVSVLIFFLLFQQGLLSGLVTQFVGALRNQDAEVLVYSELARDNIQASVIDPDAVDAVSSVDGVASTGPIGTGTFTADIQTATGQDRTDVQLFGHDLDGPGGPTALVAGRSPEGPGEAVAPADAGEGYQLGAVVALAGDGPEIEIVGLGEDLSFSVLPTLFVDMETYTEARRSQNPDATSVPPSAVGVRVEPGADADTVARAITDQVDGVDALTRAEAEQKAPGVAEVRQSFSIILLLGWITVGAVIGFFFLILTTQKLPQLTLLRALGVSAGRLALAVLTQIALVVTMALGLGLLAARTALSSGGSGISASLSGAEIGGAAVLLAVLSLIASAVSAQRIRRLDPVAAVEGGGL